MGWSFLIDSSDWRTIVIRWLFTDASLQKWIPPVFPRQRSWIHWLTQRIQDVKVVQIKILGLILFNTSLVSYCVEEEL